MATCLRPLLYWTTLFNYLKLDPVRFLFIRKTAFWEGLTYVRIHITLNSLNWHLDTESPRYSRFCWAKLSLFSFNFNLDVIILNLVSMFLGGGNNDDNPNVKRGGRRGAGGGRGEMSAQKNWEVFGSNMRKLFDLTLGKSSQQTKCQHIPLLCVNVRIVDVIPPSRKAYSQSLRLIIKSIKWGKPVPLQTLICGLFGRSRLFRMRVFCCSKMGISKWVFRKRLFQN